MYGYRARIGVLIPGVNTVMEPEFNTMRPEGVSLHFSRLPLDTANVIKSLKNMAEGVQAAAKLVADAGVDIIVYGCTAGSLVKGIGWDQEIISRIEKATAIPATTTSTAVIRAFKELGIGKVAIASPYPEELTEIEKRFFETHGIKVVNTKSLDISIEDFHCARPESTYKLVCDVNTPDADAVFITCTNFKSITVVEKLEEVLKKHVFSSNTATMWDVLKRLGITDEVKGYGTLFKH